MKEAKEALIELLAALEDIEIKAIRGKLRAIIALTDRFVPQMQANPDDEFMIHLAELRRDAIALLSECDKVSNSGDGTHLIGIKNKFQNLKEFVEFLFVLRGDEMVEQAHIAL